MEDNYSQKFDSILQPEDSLIVKIKRHKKRILVALVILFLIATLGYFVKREKGDDPSSIPPPAPEISITQTKFELISTSPTPGRIEVVFDDMAIQFIFSSKPDIDTVQLSSKPDVGLIAFVDSGGHPNGIFIRPEKQWDLGTKHEIILDIKAMDGQKLGRPIKFLYEPHLYETLPDVF